MRIEPSAKAGFTLVEIMIVVAIIGLLAAIAIPNFVRAREVSQLNSIKNNLRILEGCKDQWALEAKKGTGQTVTWTDISSYLKGATVKDVVSETYNINPVGTSANAVAAVNLTTSYDAGSVITP
jgi:prepilin-type N-terminal cleavage/methylation domain-containing protein